MSFNNQNTLSFQKENNVYSFEVCAMYIYNTHIYLYMLIHLYIVKVITYNKSSVEEDSFKHMRNSPTVQIQNFCINY